MYAHAATAYLEAATAVLAGKGLLYVSDGGEPAEARAIIDFDLSKLPALPTSHPGYEKRMEIRTRYESQNEANEFRRREIRFKAWTELYAMVKTATTDAAPMFSRQLLASESTGTSSGLTPVRLARPRSAIRSRGAHGAGARSLRQLFCAAWSRMTGRASELSKTARLRPEPMGKDLGARE